jgi:ATP:corrinoid adenosyltransferase
LENKRKTTWDLLEKVTIPEETTGYRVIYDGAGNAKTLAGFAAIGNSTRLHSEGLYAFQFKTVRHEVKKEPVFPKGKQAVERTFDLESVLEKCLAHEN